MHMVKSVGVLSVAKILGMVYGCLGLLFAPLFLLMGVIGSMAGRGQSPFAGMFGVGFAILMPVLYGAMGFVFGAIGALLYNLFARWMGGFELEFDPPPTFPASSYPIIPPAIPASNL